MRRSLPLLLAAGFVLAACSDVPTATEIAPAEEMSGISMEPAAAQAGAPIPDRYIVVFHDRVQNPAAEADALMRGRGGEIHFRYTNTIRGFAATIPAAAVEGIRRNPNVAYVEQDAVVTLTGTQTNATWGLDRIDQTNLPLDRTYTYARTGAGVTAYVVDTGILGSHVDFGGRVRQGFDAIGGRKAGTDCNGHGTHVAGTVGGDQWGVAKDVALVAVRVLDCRGSGTFSGVIAGIDWVAADAAGPSVANMSLGGGFSSSMNQAVAAAVASGVTFVVAGGNESTDACTKSPASEPSAITVGATQSNDARASYSNYGSCLDIFAPGSSITSAWHTSSTATNTISGTSMASPHVAGVAALYLESAPNASPSQVANALGSGAITGKVTSAGTGSPNRLLYTGFITGGGGGGGGGGENQSPTASFTESCTDLSCSFNASGSSDPDGSIASYAWTFGDGTDASGSTAARTYAAAGTYTVTLTVTDNSGATASTSKSVTVTSPPPSGGIVLAVGISKSRGSATANLSWTGAASSVDVRRNGSFLKTVSGTSTSDSLGKGGGTVTYQVCNAGTTTCSNPVTISY